MSDFRAIFKVSDLLKQTLWDAFNEQANNVRDIVASDAEIVYLNPTETARNSSYHLSLWLYQVTENEFVKNSPLPRNNNQITTPYAPLALNLYYLITPFSDSPDKNQILLGRTMQVMYDNAIINLRSPEDGVAEELRIVLCRLTLEELTRVWEALREPYRLSVAYQVRVIHIDSQRMESHARVLSAQRNYGPIPDSAIIGSGD